MIETTLSGANLSAANLSGGALSTANFSGADLRDTSLGGAWLNLTSLIGSNLSQAYLAGSTLLGADMTGANLSGAKLNGAILVGANLSGVDLRGADLTGAVVTLPLPPGAGEDFSYENLTGDELRQALAQTDIFKAAYDPLVLDLIESQLKPLLKDAQFQGALYDDSTIWPLGFQIPASAIKVENQP
jgi:hypothetical protein